MMTTLTQPAATTSGNPLAWLARRRPLTSYFALAYGATALLLLTLSRGRLGAASVTPAPDVPGPGRA